VVVTQEKVLDETPAWLPQRCFRAVAALFVCGVAFPAGVFSHYMSAPPEKVEATSVAIVMISTAAFFGLALVLLAILVVIRYLSLHYAGLAASRDVAERQGIRDRLISNRDKALEIFERAAVMEHSPSGHSIEAADSALKELVRDVNPLLSRR
jgi:hypothetical protein